MWKPSASDMGPLSTYSEGGRFRYCHLHCICFFGNGQKDSHHYVQQAMHKKVASKCNNFPDIVELWAPSKLHNNQDKTFQFGQ